MVANIQGLGEGGSVMIKNLELGMYISISALLLPSCVTFGFTHPRGASIFLLVNRNNQSTHLQW